MKLFCNKLCSKHYKHIHLLKSKMKLQFGNGSMYPYCSAVEKRNVADMGAVPNQAELSGWYKWWESNQFFRRIDSPQKFAMLLPPPNITGKLHIGHALTVTMQDAISRWHTMNGRDVLWIPGTDHAGIATQTVIEKQLKLKGTTRHQIGKEQFLVETYLWKGMKEDEINDQIRILGGCLSWDKKYFTMDENLSHAVSEAFIRLFEKGLIYRAKRIVNWSCSLKSVISDIEVEHLKIKKPILFSVPGYSKAIKFGQMHHISYKLTDTGEKVTFGTTRPETVLGDVALMVHPEDTRFTHLHGRTVLHPFRNEQIPILTSTSVLPEFGTGVVKITPGNSEEDFEMGKSHDLRVLDIIDDNGCINGFGEFKGLPRFDARKAVLNRLKELELYEMCVDHPMTIPICSRSGDVIEEVVKDQWFLKLNEMNRRLALAMAESRLTFTPAGVQTVMEQFLEGDRDWCISRQLWWGHRIPAYWARCGDQSEPIYVAAHSEEEARGKAAHKLGVNSSEVSLSRDDDVLDTWFSSGLLPFSSLGWPQQTVDLKTYFPNSIIETGMDIVYFWVARMAMMSEELMGTLPFKHVICHGLICDKYGKKMSKSKGNVIDPMQIINGKKVSDEANKQKGPKNAVDSPAIGVDALRLTLCSMQLQQAAVSYEQQFSRRCYLFQNKLWQSFNFVLSHSRIISGATKYMRIPHQHRVHNVFDKWILSQLAKLVNNSNSNFERYNLSPVAHQCRDFWHLSFCDKYITAVKPRIFNYESRLDEAQDAISVLWTCLHTYLRLMHPIMPFITEELYQHLPAAEGKHDSIMQCDYPAYGSLDAFINVDAENTVKTIFEAADTLRTLRSNMQISGNISATLIFDDPQLYDRCREVRSELVHLSRFADVAVSNKDPEEFADLQGNYVEKNTNYSTCLHLKGHFEPSLQWDKTRLMLDNLENKRQGFVSKNLRSLDDPEEKHELKIIDAKIVFYEKMLKIYENMGF